MSLIGIIAVSVFAFIISMTGALGCYFERRWKRFVLMLVCILISVYCFFLGMEEWLNNPQPGNLPVVVRQLPSPL